VAFEPFDALRVNVLLNQMIKDARAVVEPALNKRKAKISIVADCRYVGQGHEIRIAIPVRTLKASDGAKLKTEFEKSYQQIYNLTIPGQAAEAITWSVTASGSAASAMRSGAVLKRGAAKALRKVKLFDAKLGKEVLAPVYWRFDLGRSARIKGPAIIAEHETSTVVGAGFTATVDTMGNIILEQES
jgi:N-methylhydantoinase A